MIAVEHSRHCRPQIVSDTIAKRPKRPHNHPPAFCFLPSMGLYDRDYYREDKPGIRLGGNWSAVTTLIVANVAVSVVGLFFFPANPITKSNWLTENLGLGSDLFQHPWNAWQLITYGFVHDPTSIWHLAFNMLALWVFGRDVETVYGKVEFFKLYFSLLILAGLFDLVLKIGSPNSGRVVGASGGI